MNGAQRGLSLLTRAEAWCDLAMMASSSRFTISALWIAVLLLSATSPRHRSIGAAASSSSSSSSYWIASIKRQGSVAFGNAGYQVFRNVKDFGAIGDGNADDSDAINSAITSGGRCGQGCDSSTVSPALVYFPPGTYLISKPLVQLYYTQLVGDAVSIPTIKATAGFLGIALIDSDPYDGGGANWYTNQNNFFRQIRNFVLDVTSMPTTVGACLHWQVAQATSLQNIVFNMRTDGGDQNRQMGIFMDNGSGGFMTDLTFNGGHYGAFFGNQQFTTRNLTFNNCQTAIFMNWNWVWTLHGITINSAANVGINMSTGGVGAQTVGSLLLVDSTISNTPIGVSTAYQTTEAGTNGTLILDNVDMTNNVPVAVSSTGTGATLLAGNSKIASWIQGRQYLGANAGTVVQGKQSAATKSSVLLDASGRVFTRSKPQYESLQVSAFLSAKAYGAKGDGVTDDTDAIQALFNSASANDVVYFDHGAYLVTNTVKVPKTIRITGETWPIILAGGSMSFTDQGNPKPVFQVGQPGDTGAVEMSDLIFETQGPQPGAIMIEWNVAANSQGSAAIWDVHVRIGGSAGTKLQSDSCTKSPTVTAVAKTPCEGAFLLLHVTKQASIYIEGMWLWVADHELDLVDHSQINIFSGRGALIESSPGPVWVWGSSAEHSVMYNFQVANAANVYMGLIQTETPYFQANPNAMTPFSANSLYSDPDFSVSCGNENDMCPRAWGLRVINSQDVFIYGASLYSFFDNYSQDCVKTQSCQSNMVDLQSNSNVFVYGLTTKAATNMVTMDGESAALDSDNRNTFCATVALFKH